MHAKDEHEILKIVKDMQHDQRGQGELLKHMNDHIHRIEGKVNDMAKTLDEVLALVTAEDTKVDSLIALFAGLKQQIADLLSGANLPPALQAKVDAVFDKATSQATKIQAALDANVPPTP